MNKKELAAMIDHTLLKPNATEKMVRQTCQEAIDYQTATVCVNSYWIPLVSQLLDKTSIKPIAVVGFPLGAGLTEAKASEAKLALDAGAQEIDMVINIGELLAGNDELVQKDIQALADTCHQADTLLKVIIETSFLNDPQKVKACQLAEAAGADFVKTSTGFSDGGATTEDVALMRQTVSNKVKVKASGGIHSYEEAMTMLEAGADRLGLSGTAKVLAGVPDEEAE
ncbi:deoxyribose-phosphate aldolase [Hutsoniella sourekii]